jgi:hypothetical protein
MHLQSLKDVELCDQVMLFVARLRSFQASVNQAREDVLDKTLPGWSDEARASGFRQTTQTLQSQHQQMQDQFDSEFSADAVALQRELMARLGIPVRHDGEKLEPLRRDSADYLEELARKLVS